ncbi:MAG: DUF2892 domain-containing protein [Motiliproteus sp.]
MNVDKAVFLFAGCMILASLALSQLHHPYWLWLTAFAGANMIQASVTGFCPAAMVFKLLGLAGGCAFKGRT